MFDYIDKNITQINEAFTSGSLTSHDFVLSLLQRISEIDNGEVKYNSILEVNPNALNEALVLDEERKNGHIRSSIHGIPVILKDNINTKGAMHTTAGSITLKDNFATEDAFIVKTLKEKGAIILAKANLTEFANFMSYNMRNGYSSLGKEVLCPHNIDKDPSGSSAGSAVSVSLNLAPFSIGSETGGSIMSPSMQNGVVGLKPTIGHISRDGIIPISSTLDTAGPIAKNVTDIAYALTNLKAKDPNDPVTLIKDDSYKDYTEYLDIDGLKKLRIGINRDNFDKLPQLRKDAFLNVLNILEESGAILIDNITLNQPEKIFHIMKYEFKRNINKIS